MVFRTSNNQSEYLSYDILDHKFIRIFQPFRFVQKILGSCRVDIKDLFVTAPTLSQKCYTLICLTMTIVSSNNILETYSTIFHSEHEITTLWTVGICGLLALFSLSILHVRFLNTEANVQLYIKMQDIDRIMKLGKNGQLLYHEHYTHNRRVAFIQGAVTSTLFLVTAFLVKDKFGIMELLASSWAMETLRCEISCCASHMIYFTKRLRLINYAIRANMKNENINNTTGLCFEKLMDVFNLFNNLYRFQVFLFTVSLFGWILFTAKYAILALQSLQDNIGVNRQILCQDLLHIAVLALLQILVLVGLCVWSEHFVREVNQTKKLTITVLSRYTGGKLRTKAKNILKLIEEMSPCFSVYGMWRVDARLILYLFNIISSFLVILLQFAFL